MIQYNNNNDNDKHNDILLYVCIHTDTRATLAFTWCVHMRGHKGA